MPLIITPLFCQGAGAQGQAPVSGGATAPPTGILRIRSEPSGVLVRLYGEHRWTGTTPWDLQRGIEGTYRVIARMEGYEDWERTVSVTRGETRDLDIRLTPKAAWKAGVRSAILPGWGQFYSERPTKGTVFLVGALTLGGFLWWANEDYQDHVDDYESARDAYMETTSVNDLESMRAAAERAQDSADDAYERRQLFLFAAAGLYVASLLDAVLLSPSPAEGSFASLSPWGEDGPRITLAAPRGELTLALQLTSGEGRTR